MASDGLAPDTAEAWEKSFLSTLPERATKSLIDTAVEFDALSGQVIYRELVQPKGSFAVLVVSGILRVYISSSNGREITIRYVRRGDVSGLPSIVADGAPTGVQAVTNCRLVHIHVPTLRHLARTNPEVGWQFTREVTRVGFQTVDVIAHTFFMSIRERVIDALLRLARAEGNAMVVRTSQQEIADSIGSVREVVARALRQLSEEGLIERSKTAIVLLDLEALMKYAEHTNLPAAPRRQDDLLPADTHHPHETIVTAGSRRSP